MWTLLLLRYTENYELALKAFELSVDGLDPPLTAEDIEAKAQAICEFCVCVCAYVCVLCVCARNAYVYVYVFVCVLVCV